MNSLNGVSKFFVRADWNTTHHSAHWCPPCRGFTPKLAEAYRNIKSAGKAFEIVFVSSDKSELQFADYFREMPWLAMPYALRDLKTGLSQMFGVTGIPALILLDGATGDLISKDGRSAQNLHDTIVYVCMYTHTYQHAYLSTHMLKPTHPPTRTHTHTHTCTHTHTRL